MKILFFSHQSSFIYGGEVSTLSFMKELKKAGVEVHLAAPEGAFAKSAAKFAVVHKVPAVQFSRKIEYLPRLLPALYGVLRILRKVVREEKIDIVHAMSLKAMAYLCFGVGAPVFWHHHDILPAGKANHLWLAFFASRSRKILVPSFASKRALEKARLPREKIEVLYNGLEVERWRMRGPRISSSPLVIGFVGEISERKGIDLLPDLIFALENRLGRPFRVRVIGGELSSPRFAQDLRFSLREKVASGQVEFLGRREDVAEQLQSIDILWVPSRQEPFGIVLIEAALSGVPVVARPVGGIPEVVEPGVSGYLEDSISDMAGAMEKLAEIEHWGKLSLAAREWAQKKFDMKVLGRKLVDIYRAEL